MNKFKVFIISAFLAVTTVASLMPSQVSAQTNTNDTNQTQNNAAKCSSRFLTFPTWWRGLAVQEDCSIKLDDNLEKSAGIIVVNIVEIIIQLVGYTCVIFMITGGFYYMASAGSPDLAARGLKTIRNAAIGLVISLTSVGIVNLVASSLR